MLRSGQLRKAGPGPREEAEPARERALSTGVPALDAALGGGLLRGHLTELVAPPSAGATALFRAALGAVTRSGELCALIDPEDAFDPGGSPEPGQPDPARIDLRRLLWVRPASVALALRAAEIALEARFALVVLDLAAALPASAGPPPARSARDLFHQRTAAPLRQLQSVPAQLSLGERAARECVERIDREVRRDRPRNTGPPRPGGSPWARLSRRAERQGGTLLVIARSPQLGPFSSTTVELSRTDPRWVGHPGTPGRLLSGASGAFAVVRSRRGATSNAIALSLGWGTPS